MPRVRIYSGAGAPAAGTSAVWTLTIGGTPTSGTFKIAVAGRVTAAITWSATNATLLANIDAALEALLGTTVTTAAGSLTAGIGTITITLTGAYAKRKSPAFTIANNSLAGTNLTLAIAETTPGVSPTARSSRRPAMYVNETNGDAYVNTSGSVTAPTWTKIGTQS